VSPTSKPLQLRMASTCDEPRGAAPLLATAQSSQIALWTSGRITYAVVLWAFR